MRPLSARENCFMPVVQNWGLNLRGGFFANQLTGRSSPNRSKQSGSALEMLRKTLYGADGLWTDVMLHAFDIVMNGLGIQSEKLEKVRQEVVTVCYISCKLLSCSSQHKPSILFVFEQPFCIEFLNHVSNAGLRDRKSFCNVHDTRVTLGVNELEDLLEIVFDRGGSGACDGTWRHNSRLGKVGERVNLRREVGSTNKVRRD